MKANKKALKELNSVGKIAYHLGAMSYTETDREDLDTGYYYHTRYTFKFRVWHPVYWLIVVLLIPTGLALSVVSQIALLTKEDVCPTSSGTFNKYNQ